MSGRRGDIYAGAVIEDPDGRIEQLLPLTLDEYSRALDSICRCEVYCECSDEQIMAAHYRLVERDIEREKHAARVRGSSARRRRR